MYRKFALAALIASAAVPALADTPITVKVAGLDPKAAHAAIYQAAQAACRAELSDETDLVRFYARPECIRATVAKAEAKYEEMRGLASR